MCLLVHIQGAKSHCAGLEIHSDWTAFDNRGEAVIPSQSLQPGKGAPCAHWLMAGVKASPPSMTVEEKAVLIGLNLWGPIPRIGGDGGDGGGGGGG